jgi:hypothetical protein
VLVMEMDKKRMNLAPNSDTAVMVHETYYALGQVSNRIVDWRREQGYEKIKTCFLPKNGKACRHENQPVLG